MSFGSSRVTIASSPFIAIARLAVENPVGALLFRRTGAARRSAPRVPRPARRYLGEPIAAKIVDGRGCLENAMSLDRVGAACQPYVLSLFRFTTGLLLFQYGLAKILKFPALPNFANIPPLTMTAGALELVLGGLLMIGLLTRISALILSGEMAIAYFLGHMFKSGEPVFLPLINGGTAAILFCFACLYLSTSGGGPLSVDAAVGERRRLRHSGEAQFTAAAE
jgi:putative oxidoreductase